MRKKMKATSFVFAKKAGVRILTKHDGLIYIILMTYLRHRILQIYSVCVYVSVFIYVLAYVGRQKTGLCARLR